MQSLLSGADCSTAANPLKQVLRREGVDNSLFKVSITGSNLMFRTDTICPQDRLAPPAGSSSTISRPFSNGPISAPQELRHLNATPHPFNLSHLSADLASHSPTLKSQGNRHLDAEWDRLRGQHVPQRPQKLLDAPQPSAYGAEYSQWNQGNGHQQAQSGWAKTFQLNGKGKERVPSPSQMCSQLQARPYVSQHSYQPFQPMYFNLGQNQAYQPGVINGRSEQEQRDMEAAFERALEDARVESTTKKVQTVRADDEEIEELVREPKGDFEKVWESLRPEAERLGKLAEWESDFSQVSEVTEDGKVVLSYRVVEAIG